MRLVLALLICAALGRAAAAAEAVTVFAAASLTDVLQAIGDAYRTETGKAVRFSFAASSTLARQIEAGAPADIVASASESWMDYLAERDLIAPSTRASPIGNRLVLIAPKAAAAGTMVRIDRTLDLPALLGPEGRLAVGDPEHVPAGIYARQALQHLGLWAAVERRLARTDNVRAALALVERGEAPLGIVYATDAAVTEGVGTVGSFPADSHTPIRYPVAIVAGRDLPEVRRFHTFLTGPGGLAIFARFGFTTD